MNVSIVIPNYNGKKLLEKNLASVIAAIDYYKKEKKEEAEIIVVDDFSSDGSAEFLKSLKENSIKIIKNNKNLGFSSTINKGVGESNGDIVVLLNTDCRPKKNFLIPLSQDFSDPSVFAVGCLDKSIEGEKIVPRGRGIGFWKRGLLVHSKGDINKNNTLWVSGGSGGFRKSIWDKMGGLSEIYNPFYWEDIDISYRALKSGYKVLFENNSVVMHEHESGAIRNKFSAKTVRAIAYRNQLIFVWINADFQTLFSNLIWLPYFLIKAFSSKDWSFFTGFYQAISKVPDIINLRKKTKKLFLKRDRDVLIDLSN